MWNNKKPVGLSQALSENETFQRLQSKVDAIALDLRSTEKQTEQLSDEMVIKLLERIMQIEYRLEKLENGTRE